MNIQEMHNAFRTLGQQMGMQLIRGILPESIDVYINNVITEKTQLELLNGVRTALQDSVNTQASTMSSINAFRTLYRSARYKIDTPGLNNEASRIRDEESGIEFPDFYKVVSYNSQNGFYVINIPTVDINIALDKDEYQINPMMFLGFSVEYANTLRGNAVACRLIGADVLETTLRDYCNAASKDSPIVVLNSIPIIKNDKEELNGTANEQLEIYTNTKGCDIKYINIKYIKSPNVVKYDLDLTKCVNCDLPAYTHFDIVEKAVLKFAASIGANVPSQYAQQQPRQ